jgi:hypothetical protein
MINVQGQKSEEQGVVARLGARTSNQASHEDKRLHYTTFSPLVRNCMFHPPAPPLLGFHSIMHSAHLSSSFYYFTEQEGSFISLCFFFLLKHINRFNLTRFFVVLMNNLVMNMY